MLITDLHLALRVRKSGAVPLLPLYAYMAWTRKTVPLSFMLQLFMKQYIMLEGSCVYFKCVTMRLEKKMSRVELRMANEREESVVNQHN